MHHRRLLQQNDDIRRPGNDVSPSLLITVLILAIAVILSASLYLLLRFLRRTTTPSSATSTTSRSLSSTSILPRHVSRRVSPLIEALPLFTSDSLKSTGGGDCAVCLSKFEKKDLLRLLPLCCHVFHVDCIDTWLNSNQSCPLCRSPVFLPDSDLLSELDNNNNNNNNDVTASSSLPHSLSSSSRSFRIEIGSVSRRNNNNNTTNSGEIHGGRSYSLGGNFDYVVEDDVVSEVHSGSFRSSNSISDFFKAESDNNNQNHHHQQLASEVGTRGGGWLKDYLSHSLSSSFRSSGRWFFTGSSRREMTAPAANELELSEMDMEASRLGDEIGELFRWLSGV